jgi:endo-1,4-beta-xylanase
MKTLLTSCALTLALASLTSAQAPSDTNLRSWATHRGINVGAAVTFPTNNRAVYDSALSQNFNIMVPENAMKISNTENVRGTFTFTAADAIVEFAEAHNMKMRGHTLVWHSQAGFMANINVPRDTMLAIMKNHINTVMGRYKGRILEWDVVNEAIGQNGAASPNLRQSFWVTRIGNDFIDSAFVFARRADSNAILYYNDFGGESMNDSDPNSKSKNIYDLVKGLKDRGIPVDGIGLQSHLSGTIDTSAIGNNMRRLAALGLRISITELDIPNSGTVDSTKLADQKRKYKSLMALCASVPNCKTFMLWGLNDNQSWLGANTQALLFSGTTTLAKKPAYFGVVEALQESNRVTVSVNPAHIATKAGSKAGLYRAAQGGVVGASDARGGLRDLKGRNLPASVRRAMQP